MLACPVDLPGRGLDPVPVVKRCRKGGAIRIDDPSKAMHQTVAKFANISGTVRQHENALPVESPVLEFSGIADVRHYQRAEPAERVILEIPWI